ncbi:MAG: glycosyltransferase family 2 protein [Bacteroidetes bacterium]|nr:glycosyltransferase family 2 protein [Bacteroidota bacterium]
MDVSIIIVNYNTKDLLHNCVESVYRETKEINYEIIVVDNASVDGSQEMVETLFPKVKLIKSEENLGFGKANNVAAKKATGKYLFLLNSDTELKNNAVRLFYDFMEHYTHKNVGAVGGILLNDKNIAIHSFGKFPQLYRDLNNQIKFLIVNLIGREKYYNSMVKRRIDKTRKITTIDRDHFEVDYITGADLFLLKEVFTKFNGFDERFFMYYEETDLQLQMSRNSYKMYILSSPKIYHLEQGSFQKSIKQQLLLDKSSFIFYKKNFNIVIYTIYRIFFHIIHSLIFFDRNYTIKEKFLYIKYIIKNV